MHIFDFAEIRRCDGLYIFDGPDCMKSPGNYIQRNSY